MAPVAGQASTVGARAEERASQKRELSLSRSVCPINLSDDGAFAHGRRPVKSSSHRELRSGCFSARHSSGDGMKEALQHNPSLQLYRNGGCPSPRGRSASAASSRRASPSPSGPQTQRSPRLSSRQDASSNYRSPPGIANMGVRRRYSAPVSENESKTSPRGPPRDASSNYRSPPGIDNMGVRLRYSAPISENGSKTPPRGSPRSDWRGPFQEEQVDRGTIRLRGDGRSIGHRGRSSVGMPWRDIGNHQVKSSQIPTGADPVRGPKCAQNSPDFRGGVGMKASISNAIYNIENSPPVIADAASDRSTIGSEYNPKFHWQYKPSTKGVSSDFDTKDSCPFFRTDCSPEARVIQPATPHSRQLHATRLNNNLSGSGCVSPVAVYRALAPTDLCDPSNVAESVMEARRDWELIRQNPELHSILLTPEGSVLARSYSQQSFGSDSNRSMLSARSGVSQQTMGSLVNPIHSVRARPGEARPRWR